MYIIAFVTLDVMLKQGVPGLSLTTYPFSISTDEHVPLRFLYDKTLYHD